jgi:signal transduction histidine kinase
MDVDLGLAAKRVVESSAPLAGATHSFELEVAKTPVWVRADPTRLDSMLSNLVHNAIKYSPDGGLIKVVVSCDGTLGRATVSDEGLGIAAEDMPKLFTRFGRLVTPDNSHIPGTGLGLYITRQVATMHGGSVAVTSQPGQGTHPDER